MMTETKKGRNGMALLHLLAGIALILLHIVGCIISIISYDSTSSAIYDPKREYRSLLVSQIINTVITTLILSLMIFDIITIARSARSVTAPLFRRLRFLYLVPSIGTAIIYFIQLLSMILSNFGLDNIFLRLSDSASFCLHPEIFRELTVDHCSIFSLLYMFRFFILNLSPIVVFLLSFFTITKQTNSTLLMVLYEAGTLDVKTSRPILQTKSNTQNTKEAGSVTTTTPLLHHSAEGYNSQAGKSTLKASTPLESKSESQPRKSFLKARVRRKSENADVFVSLPQLRAPSVRRFEASNTSTDQIEEFVFEDESEDEPDYFT
ncbi:hypothetical protein BLNAU_5708 [Blattamonas nauphoetae]|uniref:Transmembrane protein n=1 Tax=Blattamonas nauphoetae TaxID=2049346 RepID=A0ABQ9Y6U4_9EUKA|nr:hypothetical protein BLNAU_5708 [Blattamonas nauphoetae]